MNSSTLVDCTADPSGFLDSVRKALTEGYRFVPLIGAGLSLPSGIPITVQFRRYLAYCFLKAFGIRLSTDWDRIRRGDIQEDERLWNPRRDPWPSIEREEVQLNSAFSVEALDGLLYAAMELAAKRDNTKRYELLRQAFGSLGDWRNALDILARLTVVRDGRELVAQAPDFSVRDSFFRFFVHGREPNLGHHLLPALASVLRFSTILTTNFDDLIEQSFQAAGVPLSVFEVPAQSSFPSAKLVLARRSLVKLHGGQHGLRADYSLDELPSRADEWNFLSYLAGRPLERDTERIADDEYSQPDKIALLICGYAGGELRTMELLKTAFRFFRDLRVYWIATRQNSRNKIAEIWSRQHLTEKPPRAFVTAHPQLPLFLFELFQICANDIPVAGVAFPSPWHFAFPPLLDKPGTNETKAEFERVFDLAVDRMKNSAAPLLIVTDVECFGGVTVGSNLFRHPFLESKKRVWIDLENVDEPIGIPFRIALALQKLSGTQDPIVSLPTNDAAESKREFLALLQRRIVHWSLVLDSDCYIFINGQEGAGVNSFFSSTSPSKPHVNWSNSSDLAAVFRCIADLHSDSSSRIKFIFLCRKGEHFHKELENHVPFSHWVKSRLVIGKPGASEYNPTSLLASVSSDSEEQWRLITLFIITSIRLSRYRATIINTVFRVLDAFRELIVLPTEPPSGDVIHAYIEELLEQGIVRIQYGGCLWMHHELRTKIEAYLSNKILLRQRLIIGLCISRAYGRMLLASADPLSAIEGMRHGITSIKAATPEQSDPGIRDYSLKIVRYCRLLLKTTGRLFEQRLSDHLVDRALSVLQHLLSDTITAVSGQDANTVVTELIALAADISRIQLQTLQLQGEFARIIQLADQTQLNRETQRLFIVSASLGLRNYSGAHRQLEEAWVQSVGKPEFRSMAHPMSQADAFISEMQSNGFSSHRINDELRGRVLLCLRSGYFHLNECQLRYVSSCATDGQATQKTRNARLHGLERALFFFQYGIELLRMTTNVDERTFRWNARCRAHAALASALVGVHRKESRDQNWRAAERLLMDAEAFLVEYPAADDTLTRAILELRRAEVLLIQVGVDDSFRKIRRTLRREIDKRETRPNLATSTHVARIYESFRSIERSEELLRLYPKSRWWWWIATVLKLKAAEYLFVVRCLLDQDTRISGTLGAHARIIPGNVRAYFDYGVMKAIQERDLRDIFYLSRALDSYISSIYAQRCYVKVHSRAFKNEKVWRTNLVVLQHDLRTVVDYATRAPENERPDVSAIDYAKSCLARTSQCINTAL